MHGHTCQNGVNCLRNEERRQENYQSGRSCQSLAEIPELHVLDKGHRGCQLDLGTVEEVQKTFKTLSAAGVLKAAPEIPLNGDITGNAGGLVEDEMIEIEGVDMDDDMATIAEKLGLDESLVTSRAVAETLSSMQETISAGSIADSLSSIGETIEIDESLITSEAMRETLSTLQETISEEISEEYSPPPAIDPATGAAPKPPG